MIITKYPQSAILLEYKNRRILIDPGSYCYNENFAPDDWGRIDILLITHNHPDHFMPEAIRIIKQNNPNLTILSNREVQEELKNENINCEVLEPSREKWIGDIKIKGIKSIHGKLPSGNPAPDVVGFLIDNRFYHPGDTIYLREKPYADIVFVPICGRVVMNPKEAAKFIKEINPKLAIPIHYDSPNYPVDISEFTKEMRGCNVKVLKNGESIKIE